MIEGPDFVVQSRDDTTRYTIRVLDENGNPPDFSLSMDSENVGIRFDVLDTSDADVSEGRAVFAGWGECSRPTGQYSRRHGS